MKYNLSMFNSMKNDPTSNPMQAVVNIRDKFVIYSLVFVSATRVIRQGIIHRSFLKRTHTDV